MNPLSFFDFIFSYFLDSTLATVSNDDPISFINLQTDEISSYTEVNANCCNFDSTGNYLGIGLNNGIVNVLDLKNNPYRKKSHKV